MLSEKYLFVKFNRELKGFGEELNNEAIGLMRMCPILMILGNVSARTMVFVINNKEIEWGNYIPDFVVLTICLVLNLFSTQTLNNFFRRIFRLKKSDISNSLEYSDAL